MQCKGLYHILDRKRPRTKKEREKEEGVQRSPTNNSYPTKETVQLPKQVTRELGISGAGLKVGRQEMN